MVGGNTFVKIAGGHIGRSVYGGGAMASVGTITNAADTATTAKHADIRIVDGKETVYGFALSWPYKFVFADNTGKATVNVTGGHIGTRQLDGGDIYGSSRGEAGDRYATAHLAVVKETEVTIDYPETTKMTDEETIQNDFTKQCVTGSVHGSGEDGYVYGDTYVTLNNGLIGHSLYGAGKGAGTYEITLNKIGGEGTTYKSNIYSLISGRVMGNTYVTMNGGRVGRNVYGGGNMASVGKGNFASGTDDYYPSGYGEKIESALFTSSTEGDDAWHFLNSGKTTVRVLGGTVGYIDDTDPGSSMKNDLPYGNVFGGSAGEAAPNVPADLTPRYHYCPAFFSGYVNETDVTIGGYRCKTECTIGDKTYKVGDVLSADKYDALASGKDNWELAGPTILASVYGGGQDGHVRRDTKVTVYAGEIGRLYDDVNRRRLQTDDINNEQWLHRGNVYGAGSGISQYTSSLEYADGYSGDKVAASGFSTSAGSVTRFTTVDIKGGLIYRNVYGGGSMASVGAPKIGQTYDPYLPTDPNHVNEFGKQSLNLVTIGGLKIGETVIRPQIGAIEGYGGSVFGASRGNTSLDENRFSTSIWTKVFIKDGAKILGNVFGGGDNGLVKKDAKVIVGEKADGSE